METSSWIRRFGGALTAVVLVSVALADPAAAASSTASTTADTLATTSVDAPAAPNATETNGPLGKTTICVNAYLQGFEWQGWFCEADGVAVHVGTTGQHRAIEALAISTYGTNGLCMQAHSAGFGWLGVACTETDGAVVTVGTMGFNRALEGLNIALGKGTLGARAHVAGIGWQPWQSVGHGNSLFLGTTGQRRAMEALEVYTTE